MAALSTPPRQVETLLGVLRNRLRRPGAPPSLVRCVLTPSPSAAYPLSPAAPGAPPSEQLVDHGPTAPPLRPIAGYRVPDTSGVQ